MNAFLAIICSIGIIFLGIRILLKKENTDLNELLFYKFFEVKNENKFRIASGLFYLAFGIMGFSIGIAAQIENKAMAYSIANIMAIVLLILSINVIRLLSLRK